MAYRHCIVFVTLCFLTACNAETDVAANGIAVNPPNVIIILADDLGYGDVSSNGATQLSTPNIDSLATDGVRFTNSYASGNVCTPSRAGLLTGKYSIRVGLADKTISETDPRGLPAAEQTIAEIFQANGYRTGLVGKWHLGHTTPEMLPLEQGFDYFYGLRRSNDAEELFYIRDATKLDAPVVQEELTSRWTEEAIQFIETDDSQPFFLLLSHTAPHKPFHPSSEFKTKSGLGPYGDLVLEIDNSVAEVQGALQRSGKDKNTIVVFTSDNGPFPEGSAGGLRGGKGTSWDGGYRVPMIVRWPDGIVGGETVSGISMNIDLLPSLAELASLQVPPGLNLDGRSFVPMLSGKNESPHAALFHFNDERIAAVRAQNWRLVLSDYAPWRDAKPFDFQNSSSLYPLLFDMRVDAAERYNVSQKYPDEFNDMLKLLEAGRKDLEQYAQHSLADTFTNGVGD